jgi:hypothetical protein
MASYLQAGWFAEDKPHELRTEVLDGAVDAAGALYRAAVPPGVIWRLAMKVRTLAKVADPDLRGDVRFTAADREIICARLDRAAHPYAPLSGFLLDWIEHVHTPADLNALFLHLVHIHRLTQLFNHAALLREGLASALTQTTTKSRKGRARRARHKQ